MPTDVLEQLASALGPVLEQQKARAFGVGYKHDASGTPIEVGYSHGPGGRLTYPGVDPILFNTAMGANSIIDQIPAVPSVYTNPTYMTITGVTDMTGNNKEDVCDDAPTAGLMKGCLVTSVFGRYEVATPELELNRLGQRIDRADPLDLQLVGTPFQVNGPFAGGQANASTPGDLLINEVSRKFWERNVAFHRILARQIWSGTPANNSGGGGYKEMTGLSVLVNTGYKDAESGVACPAMDSYLVDFNYGSISSNGAAVVAAVTDMYYQMKTRATMMGLDPVRWIFAMPSQMFYELSAVWPCAYLSYRCSPSNGALEFIDSQDAIRFRDEMRAGRYLLIDGERVSVALDDGIALLNGNNSGGNFPSGCFGSDIYLIPMSVAGGRAVTYMEYFQYANPSIEMALGNMVLGRIEGAFLTWPRQTNQCVVWQSKIEPRLIMRTPWLAARLQHVVYCPTSAERSSFPTDSAGLVNPYWADGGGTSRDQGGPNGGPSLYSLWGN